MKEIVQVLEDYKKKDPQGYLQILQESNEVLEQLLIELNEGLRLLRGI